MAHEDCPELTGNEMLRKAAEINLEYGAKIEALVGHLSYSECRELFRVCDLAKSNNCPANLYYAVPDVKDAILNLMLWHQFNESVHGIALE